MTEMKKLLYTIAKDKIGENILIKNAQKSVSYFCIECGGVMLVRKSGKSGKGSKRPHFAHKSLTSNCTPEGVLHMGFKKLATKFIETKIAKNEPINISWGCIFCCERHSGNLLKNVVEVKEEFYLGECRPDISLLDSEGKVTKVIEVVVTHKPEIQTLEYYKNNNIVMVQYDLLTEDDLNNYEIKIVSPDVLGVCPNPKCKKCKTPQPKVKMLIIDGECYNCNKIMKSATIMLSNKGVIEGSLHLPPEGFNDKWLDFAKSKGVTLQTRYSKGARRSYIASVCPNCNYFSWSNRNFSQFVDPALLGDFPYKEYEVGYHCSSCEERELLHIDSE